MEGVGETVTLWEALGEVADPRDSCGKRYPLQGILGIVVAAIIGGRESVAGISRWGRKLKGRQLRELGIERKRGPCQATYHNVLKEISEAELEGQLGRWVRGWVGDRPIGHVAMDGKSLRGSHSGEYPAVHLLALYCAAAQGVLGQMRMEPGTNEITAAKALLKAVPLSQTIVTGDAIFTQKEICQDIVERGGDYFFTVKDNQKDLREAIETSFAPSLSPSGATDEGARS